jgi:glycolate oxidase
MHTHMTPERMDSLIAKLTQVVGENDIRTTTAELYAYATDASIHRRMPDVVVRPETAKEVSQIVELANEYLIPIVGRGAGTALCGHAVPIDGGIVVNFQKMNRVLENHIEDLYVVVEPGLLCNDLNAMLSPLGFTFPPDPGSSHSCTIGGMVIANASGQRAIKYGATRDYVLGLEVVLPTGELVEMGTRTLKSAAGLQLARLMVGSEGTLGLVTKINLKVIPRPHKTASAIAAFDNLDDAARSVGAIIRAPIIPARMEFMDRICIQAVNKAQDMGLPEVEALLMIGSDGRDEAVADEIEAVAKICKKEGAISVDTTVDPKEEEKLWSGRKAMIPALSAFREGWVCVMLADDMAVPMSKIPETVRAFHEIAEKYGIYIPTYGHAGDGNLHTKIIMDPLSQEHWDAVEKAVPEIYDAVHRVGGTTTGEHGISISKAPFLFKEKGAANVEAMKAIKEALDPNNIMNPHKMMQWTGSFITHNRYKIIPGPGATDKNLWKWNDEMNVCTYCGYCKVVCPTFNETLWDSKSARGRVLVSYGVLHGDIPIDESTVDALYSCTMCRDCYRRCPSKVHVPEIVKAARADLVCAGMATAIQEGVIDNIRKTGNIFGDTEILIEPQEGDVPLFIGCQYLSRPNQTKRYIKLLEKLGIKPRIVPEICCGYPMEALGFREEFEEHKRKLTELFPYKECITLCPTCTAYFREEYGINARHVLEVFLEKAPETHLDMKVTYHDPCDLSRGIGLYNEPRELLSRLGVEVVEMKQNKNLSRCCGAGGGILMYDPDMADALGKTRVRQAIATGAETLVTACATCEAALKKAAAALDEEGAGKVAVRNISDIMWKALK